MMKTRRGFPRSSVRRLPHCVYCVVFLRDSLNGRCHHEAPLDTRMPAAVPRARFVSMLRPAGRRPGGRGRDGDGRSLSRRRVSLARYLPCFRAGWREVSDFGFWIGLIQHRHFSGKSRSGSNRRGFFGFSIRIRKTIQNPKSKIQNRNPSAQRTPPASASVHVLHIMPSFLVARDVHPRSQS